MTMPADREIFKNAPIKEAIVEIAFEPLDESFIGMLESFETLLPNHRNKKAVHMHQVQLSMDPAIAPTPTQTVQSTLMGFQFWSDDEKEVYTVRLQGFAFHKLKPYSKWEDVLPKFLDGWKIFNEHVKKFTPVLAVVRNINLIEIPELQFELDHYLKAGFALPEGVDGPLSEFFSRVTIDFPETHSKCNVTTAKQPLANENDTKTSIVLDIESIQQVKGPLSVDQVSKMLTNLNDNKNKVFNGTVTEPAKELFR